MSKSILQPYLDLLRAYRRKTMNANTFCSAYLALYTEDQDARKALPRAQKRHLQNLFEACESLQTPPHQRDRYEYGPEDLWQDAEKIAAALDPVKT